MSLKEYVKNATSLKLPSPLKTVITNRKDVDLEKTIKKAQSVFS